MPSVMTLRLWREYRGLSLRELGEKSGIAYSNLSRIETGQLDPRLSTLQRLADALDLTVADLVSRKPPARRKKT